MSQELKYVKLSNDNVIIFDCEIQHDTFKNLNPVSAGFCRVRSNKVYCYGNSYSLGLESVMREDTMQATRCVFGIKAMINLIKK